MKFVESLSESYVDSFSSEGEFVPYSSEIWGLIERAYEAGFRKAREMALSAIDDSGADPTGYIYGFVCNLGEEEVA